jgi:predicted ATPase
MVTLSEEQEFPNFLAYGTILQGRALAEQGRGEEGIVQICQGLAACQAMGQKLGRPYFLSLLAEAYGAAGQVREGLNVLNEALAAVHKTRECIHEAELYRLKGALTLQSQTSLGQVKASPKIPTPNP